MGILRIIRRVMDFLSKKTDMNILHLFSYPLSKLYSKKVDEGILAFGSSNGKSFAGNSKELFLFLSKNSNYHCVWITASEEIFKDLSRENYNVVLSTKLFKTIKILKAAKYIFITNGFGDILMIDFSPDTRLIHLEHGTKLKKEGYDLEKMPLKIFDKLIFNKLKKSISYMIVPSNEAKKLKQSSFRLSNSKFLITGYPRNDILTTFDENLQNKIIKDLDIEKDDEIVLYAPTFRDYEYKNPFNESFFERLNDFLLRENKVLLFKPHPFMDKVNLSKYKKIKSINPNVDIKDLMIISDILITDYSGVFFDFLLTMRPILFYSYDLEKYLRERDIYYDYKSFVPGPIVKTSEELINKLKDVSKWDQEYEIKRRNTLDLFNYYKDGNSTQRIIDILDIKLKPFITKPRPIRKIIIEKRSAKIGKAVNNLLELVSEKISMNIKHLISYPISRLINNNINDNLLVFGSANGNAFTGNTKVVFQYLTKNSNYTCVWITASEEVFQDLKKQGYHVILNRNFIKAIKYLKAAKCIFISHGFGDILLIDFSPKTQLIHLAHGISFKKGGHDLDRSSLPFFEKKVNDVLAKCITFLIDSSEETKKKKLTKFGILSSKVKVLGYPRNDILINHTKELRENIKKELKLEKYKEILLYAPTFRDYNYDIPLKKNILVKLEDFLIKENKVLLYKPHPFMAEKNLSQYKNIIAVERLGDIKELLIISDILITDYSSVFYDYLLTLRPIIFFADDLERYTKVRDFYYDYESFVPGPFVRSGEDLIEKLRSLETWDFEFREKRKIMRDKFNKYSDGKATERIIELLNLKTYRHL